MRVARATIADLPGWLRLAGEVEPLFGPMVGDLAFESALRRGVERGSAYCVREGDGPPGTPLLGGLLFSARPPRYRIGWLAVAGRSRRRGVGTLLASHVCGLVQPPAEMTVVTFAEGVEAGRAARALYERLGFRPAEPAPPNPAGYPCQVFRRAF